MSEQVEKKEIVKIIAINKMYKEKPYFSCMPYDNTKRMNVNGLENLTDKQRQECPFIPKIEEHFSVSNNDELVLTKKSNGEYVIDKNFVLYSLYKVDPNIANSRNEVIKGVHLFYLENYEKEAEKSVSVSKLKNKAGGKVAELSTLTDIYDILFYLGESPTNLSHVRAEKMLYDKVETRYEDVLKYFTDLEQSKKITFGAHDVSILS